MEDDEHIEDEEDDSEPMDEEEDDSDNAARESINDDEILDKGKPEMDLIGAYRRRGHPDDTH